MHPNETPQLTPSKTMLARFDTELERRAYVLGHSSGYWHGREDAGKPRLDDISNPNNTRSKAMDEVETFARTFWMTMDWKQAGKILAYGGVLGAVAAAGVMALTMSTVKTNILP